MSAEVSYCYRYGKLHKGAWAVEIQRLEMWAPFARDIRTVAVVGSKREAQAITRYRANFGREDWPVSA